MPEIDQTRCAYCLKHLGPFFRHNYITYHKPMTFEVGKIQSPQDLAKSIDDQKVKVCLECAADMGIKVDWA